jgi:hypothetical protein
MIDTQVLQPQSPEVVASGIGEMQSAQWIRNWYIESRSRLEAETDASFHRCAHLWSGIRPKEEMHVCSITWQRLRR